MFDFCGRFGGENRPGRDLKSFMEVVRFILTEYEPVGSQGDPVLRNFNRFPMGAFNMRESLGLS